jgi:chemosensory pili system protein ChpA (sensor histidine kinase/response regulator)
VLAVDDSHVIRRVVEVSLQQLNVEVETAGSGSVACELMQRSVPDLLILDVGLPDMTGWDVIDFVREERALDGLPVVMLTGYSDASDRHRADDAGVERYLVKPFRPADLRRAVLDILHAADDQLGFVGPA